MAEERMSPQSKDYVELLFHWHRYLTVAPWIKDKRVVEIGSGNGYGARYMADFALAVKGVDIDPEAIASAREYYFHPRLQFTQGGLPELPFEDRYADVVVFFEVLEHLDPAIHERSMREISRILKPDGVFFISTPDHDRTQSFSEVNPYHIGEVNGPGLKHLLSSNFEHVKLYYQEINAASLIWAPDHPQASPTYGILVDDQGSSPAAPETSIHLTLMAMASQVPLDGSLASSCVETERVILSTLWRQLGVALDGRQALSQRVEQMAEEQMRLEDEIERVAQDNYQLSSAYVAMLEQSDQLQREVEHLKAVEQELILLQQQFRQVSDDLAIVHNARSWRLIQRYWRFMDHSPWGRVLKKARARVMSTPKDPRRS